MFSKLISLRITGPLSIAASRIDSFDPFNILELIDFPPTPGLFQHLRVPPRLARLLPSKLRRWLESW
jgi:hypothetical protein